MQIVFEVKTFSWRPTLQSSFPSDRSSEILNVNASFVTNLKPTTIVQQCNYTSYRRVVVKQDLYLAHLLS
jgi:hypothetical protein